MLKSSWAYLLALMHKNEISLLCFSTTTDPVLELWQYCACASTATMPCHFTFTTRHFITCSASFVCSLDWLQGVTKCFYNRLHLSNTKVAKHLVVAKLHGKVWTKSKKFMYWEEKNRKKYFESPMKVLSDNFFNGDFLTSQEVYKCTYTHNKTCLQFEMLITLCNLKNVKTFANRNQPNLHNTLKKLNMF